MTYSNCINALAKVSKVFDAGKKLGKLIVEVCIIGALAVAALAAKLVGMKDSEDDLVLVGDEPP